MVLMHTPEVNRGWLAPDFKLIGIDDKNYSLEDVRGENGLVVMFIANHCPYVKSIIHKIVRDVKELQELGIGAVAIAANDVVKYPEDSFENMKQVAEEKGFTFPYLFDQTQEIAKSYDAVCTPDFFGFNKDLELQYRGRLDESGREDIPGGKRELFEAMKVVAETGRGPAEQNPSMGCSIKWKDAD